MDTMIDPQVLQLKAKLFRGLADPSRLSILEVLRDGPRTVTDLVNMTGLSQPNVSNHLSCLRDCGLVRGTQNGRQVIYEIADDRILTLLHNGEEILADSAKGVYECTRYTINNTK